MPRPGSKAWIMMIQRVFRFSVMLVTIGLLLRFLVSSFPTIEQLGILKSVARVIMYPSITFITLIYFLSCFEPVKLPIVWEKVYPQLRK